MSAFTRNVSLLFQTCTERVSTVQVTEKQLSDPHVWAWYPTSLSILHLSLLPSVCCDQEPFHRAVIEFPRSPSGLVNCCFPLLPLRASVYFDKGMAFGAFQYPDKQQGVSVKSVCDKYNSMGD